MSERMDQDDAIRQIIKQCQTVFIIDTKERLMAMHERIASWQHNQLTHEELVNSIYEHVHVIKGTALTLHYFQIDAVCTQLVNAVKERAAEVWSGLETQMLVDRVYKLEEALNIENHSGS